MYYACTASQLPRRPCCQRVRRTCTQATVDPGMFQAYGNSFPLLPCCLGCRRFCLCHSTSLYTGITFHNRMFLPDGPAGLCGRPSIARSYGMNTFRLVTDGPQRVEVHGRRIQPQDEFRSTHHPAKIIKTHLHGFLKILHTNCISWV